METDRDMTLGPTGGQVADNVRRLRQAKGWSLQGLADALEAVGHPIPRTGLGKLELRARRVDVDDLMALAVALEVNPSALLLPSRADDAEIELTATVSDPAWAVWQWAAGEHPLSGFSEDDLGKTIDDLDLAEIELRQEDFRRRVLPRDLRIAEKHPANRAAASVAAGVAEFVQTRSAVFRRLVGRTMGELEKALDGLAADGDA